MSNRVMVNPEARSPYQRYGKTPYPYPAWVREARDPPADILKELERARAAVKKQHQRTPSAPTAHSERERGGTAPLGTPRPTGRPHTHRPVRPAAQERRGDPRTVASA